MFSIHVRFLTKRFYGSDFRDRSQPEWPPHPCRLFSALTAAAYESDENENLLEALRWLESELPPSIKASSASTRAVCKHFVPVNYEIGNKKQGIDLTPGARNSRQPRYFPSVTPDSESIAFVWKESEPSFQTFESLKKLCSLVQSLGHSSSLCSLCVSRNDIACNYRPAENGDLSIRVPYMGRLKELDFQFSRGFRPQVGKTISYEHGDGAKHHIIGQLGEIFAWRFGEGIIPQLESSLALCSKLRDALISLGGDSTPKSIHGHGGEHLKIFPLPYVGSKYSDGRLMGLAIGLPNDLSFSERQQILWILGKLSELNMGKSGALQLERVGSTTSKTLQTKTWTSASKKWATVTPVVLPVYPKRKSGKDVIDIVTRLIHQANLPAPSKINYSVKPYLKGVKSSSDFVSSRKRGDRPLPAYHFRVEFHELATGPILLGVNRYFGMGFFKPLDTHENKV